MLLSTVDPELERSLESVAAKAIAKVRAKSSAGKVCESSLQLLQLQPLAAPAAGYVWRFDACAAPYSTNVHASRPQHAANGPPAAAEVCHSLLVLLCCVLLCLQPHAFEARQVPANMYENRYSSTVEAKLAAHRCVRLLLLCTPARAGEKL